MGRVSELIKILPTWSLFSPEVEAGGKGVYPEKLLKRLLFCGRKLFWYENGKIVGREKREFAKKFH